LRRHSAVNDDVADNWAWPASPAAIVLAPLSELASQRSHFLKPCRHITEYCSDTDYSAAVVAEWQNRELDRDPAAVLAKRWHRQDLAGTVTRAPAPHLALKPAQ
jgi:hypothetical protein